MEFGHMHMTFAEHVGEVSPSQETPARFAQLRSRNTRRAFNQRELIAWHMRVESLAESQLIQ
jgi:hypothetical protein